MIKTFLILFCLFIFVCCNKPRYEEDEFKTWRSVENRLQYRDWHITKVLIDNKDSTFLVLDPNNRIPSYYTFADYNPRSRTYNFGVKMEGDKEYINFPDSFTLGNTYGVYEFIYTFGSNNIDQPLYLIGTSSHYLTQGYIKPHGALANYRNTIPWTIKKLTKKEFHIVTNYKNLTYEIFFES